MEVQDLQKHFKKMGARVKVRPSRQRLAFDIKRDRDGEYFEIQTNGERLELLQEQPKAKHLLLYADNGDRFLCGHDERHWFVAGIEGKVSTVADAKRSLLPQAVRQSVDTKSPALVNQRRNDVFIRQGEWFFVPTDEPLEGRPILKNELLQRTAASKPHLCQELIRFGGEQVHIVRSGVWRNPKTETLTSAEYQQRFAENPRAFRNAVVRTMLRNPRVYVRGTVRHADHATITLKTWHRVFLNAEYNINGSVQFLD